MYEKIGNKKEKIKYIILDFGKVLAYPISGHWFITPKFWGIIDKKSIDINKLTESMKKYNYMLDDFVKNEDEEYEMFYEFYKKVLEEIKYKEDIKSAAEKLSNDCVFNDNKYKLYDDVKLVLKELSQRYTLLLLSDNWPSVLRMMKNYGIYDFFDKIYISSIYESQKKDKIFFDYPINDYKIKSDEAIFVDDNINLLKIAKEKGLIPIAMDRENNLKECIYDIIKSLKELCYK